MSMLITGLLLTAAAAESSVPMEPLEGSVGPYQGRQTMFINGEPQTPLVYVLTEQSRFTWQALPQRHMRQFAEAGHRMYQFDVWFRDVWAEDDSLDIALVQRQIRGILNVCPDAALFMRVNLRAPMWWNRRYPDECAQFATGPIAEGGRDDPDGDLERGMRCSFASEQWREDAGRQLTRFCNELLATEESNHIVGMQVTGGIYGEWHHWSFIGHHPDVGPAMTRRFRAWLREAYGTDAALQEAWGDPEVTLDTAEPPGLAPRLESQAGVFRDPARERWMIDYGHCHQRTVEECVLHFCRTAKESWTRPLIIGIFHNYFFYQKEMVEGGHLELAKILESPYIDYLSAPFSYDSDARWPGGTGHPRGLLETVRLNGKLWMNEVDQPTHVGDIVGRPWPETPRTESESIAIMRRNFLQSFCRGHGAWWYDFGPAHTEEGATGWFDTPGLMEEVRKLRVRADEVIQTPYAPQADVLMVYDTECFYYLSLPESPDYTSYASVNRSQTLIHHAGVMADSVLLQDLPKAELDRYKVVMFMQTPLLNEEQIAFIRDRVATDGRTVVWSYAPGYTDGESLSLDRVCEATGFRLAPMSLDGETATIEITSDDLPAVTYPIVETSENVAPPPYPVDRKPDPLFAVDDPDAEVLGVFSGGTVPALARKRHDDCTVWYTSLPPLHSALLREICRDAGAHVYVDSDETLLAGGGMIVLHTVTGGPRELRLRNGRTVEVELPPFSTKALDAETGADMLD